MDLIQDNILEIMLLIGVLFLSIGFFMLSVSCGFIVTGALLYGTSIILVRLRKERID
ncbi:hypothetical protein [Lysinibacillus fusiformis]|uniref:hypothetical protein n=1 Tax=Lysinibacillus fusiformis TaxID=28031 RepID=UPI003017C945